MRDLTKSVVSAATLLVAPQLAAQDDPGRDTGPPITPVMAGIQAEVVLTGLQAPTGIAVRPGGNEASFELFVSDSGTGRIVRVTNNAADEARDAIIGLAGSTDTDSAEQPLGRLPLLFLNSRTLVVGRMPTADSSRLADIYELTNDAAPLTADQVKQSLELARESNDTDVTASHLLCLAANQDALFVSMASVTQQQGILRAKIGGDVLGDPRVLIAARSEDARHAPSGMVIDQKMGKGYLVVTHLGNIDQEADSGLTFYNPYNGQLLFHVATQLVDMAGLAYSPRTGWLYTLDAALIGAEPGGVFRLDSASSDSARPRQTCRAVPVVRLHRPTALAFGPDQALYVTALGPTDHSSDEPPGIVLRITGKL